MEKFIEKIAQHIHQEDLSLRDLVVVLPSERAKKYLQDALFTAYGKPIFSPKIITMNRWIYELTELSIIDTTRALFKLYEVHLEVDKEEPQTLDEFLKWGRILLSDFDEIDRYLINSKDLFKNLADIKDIENWSFGDPEKLTEGQKKYMRFWDLLQNYYVKFNERLEKDGECYMGQAYKTVATNINVVFKENKDAQFIFAGFNALSAAEIAIMKQLHTLGKAEVFIDADEFYLNDKNHEAGAFIRHFLSELKVKTLPFVGNKLKTEAKNFTIINCAQPTGQAKVSGTILEQEIELKDRSETLLLLGDESLIVPVIKNIPRKILEANITLGLPLKNTAVKSWTDLIFSAQEHFQQFNTKRIYHRDFIRFIKHPFIIGFATPEETIAISEVERTILNKNWTFIYPDSLDLPERIKELIQLFFHPWNTVQKEYPLARIREINQLLYAGLSNEDNAIERAVLYHFDRSLVKLENVLEEFKPEIHLGTFKSLFQQHWVNESIAYLGNPLDGLQVMGLLETRLLDFKNVIVVGLNDGSMPPTNPIQSMIMMDLRRYFNLPTPRDKQGLFAHHFYRLLHHAENVWITYSSSEADSGGMGEPSRYILQLELELARQNEKVKFQRLDYTIGNEEENSQAVRVEVNEAIIKRLDEYFANRTSHSALKTYMRCSLDFYYKYLLGLGQEDKVEEEIEASTFGSFIHETLEELYKPFAKWDENGQPLPSKQKAVTSFDIDNMLAKQSSVMAKHFQAYFHYDEQPEGKNFLGLEIANHLTAQFLKQEREQLKNLEGHLFIHGLEINLKKELSLPIMGEQKTVKFTGIVDRIDEIDGKTRILDYKSGKCSKSEVTIRAAKKGANKEEKIDRLTSILKGQNHVFQLLLYNMLFFEKFNYYPDLVGIISMVNLHDSPFYLDNKLTDTTEELMELFEKALTDIISEIYDEETPFEHTSADYFNFCDYCV